MPRPQRAREALAKRWPEVHGAFREFMRGLTLAKLETVVHFRNLKGKAKAGRLGDLLGHVMDHATYHRGQQATLLKMAGATPIYVPFYLWREANPDV